MKISKIREKTKIFQFLQKEKYLHLYSIGDLDDFFWPYTTWYGMESSGGIDSVMMLYHGQTPPTLLALSSDIGPAGQLLSAVMDILPDHFFAHLSPGLEKPFELNFQLLSHGLHYKMALIDHANVFDVDCTEVKQFGEREIDEIRELYESSYPGNWFDPRMLDTGKYFGIREDGQLVSLAGVHVYSKSYQVAALGNITTRPSHRNRGYASKAAAKLCQTLLVEKLLVGLNVAAENLPAIECYRKLGFQIIANYNEYTITKKV